MKLYSGIDLHSSSSYVAICYRFSDTLDMNILWLTDIHLDYIFLRDSFRWQLCPWQCTCCGIRSRFTSFNKTIYCLLLNKFKIGDFNTALHFFFK
jgi:hypothetical protein